MTLKDRGTIKWTSLMLPEHVERIKQLKKELNKVEKPEIDEQRLQEMEQIIAQAYAKNIPLAFTYWDDGFYKTASGKIGRIDHFAKQLHIKNSSLERFTIPFAHIVDVAFDDDKKK